MKIYIYWWSSLDLSETVFSPYGHQLSQSLFQLMKFVSAKPKAQIFMAHSVKEGQSLPLASDCQNQDKIL